MFVDEAPSVCSGGPERVGSFTLSTNNTPDPPILLFVFRCYWMENVFLIGPSKQCEWIELLLVTTVR